MLQTQILQNQIELHFSSGRFSPEHLFVIDGS
jgi:hypothetical protein